MQDILIFGLSLIISLPIALLIVNQIFKKSILGYFLKYTLVLVYYCSLVSFIVGKLGLINMAWSFPSAFGVGVIIFIIINKRLKLPLVQSIKTLSEISNGALNKKIEVSDKKDELGELNNTIITLQKGLISFFDDLNKNASFLSECGLELSNSSQTLAQNSNEQASSVEEISSTMEEISSNIDQNTFNSNQANEVSLKSSKTMDSAKANVNGTSQSIQSIAEKIAIISSISQQTNILALIAAVEAARVGEAGKGFSVVASEVRKLADRSNIAAAEITSLVNNSVENAITSDKEFDKLIPEISKAQHLIREISAAGIEQSNGVSQVNLALQELNNVTQSNANTADSLSVKAAEFLSSSDKLSERLKFFKL